MIPVTVLGTAEKWNANAWKTEAFTEIRSPDSLFKITTPMHCVCFDNKTKRSIYVATVSTFYLRRTSYLPMLEDTYSCSHMGDNDADLGTRDR